jgi:lactoylglutathione lyase
MKGLRTCIYKVAQLDEAKAWYAKAFGVDPYFDEPFYVGFNIGGYELGLQEEEIAVTEKSENVHVLWGVDDIHQSYEHLISIGATTTRNPTM